MQKSFKHIFKVKYNREHSESVRKTFNDHLQISKLSQKLIFLKREPKIAGSIWGSFDD